MSDPTSEQPWTVLRLIDWTKNYFADKQMDSPRLAAEVLLAHTLECPRLGLYTQFDKVPGESQLTAFRKLVKRAAAAEPVAYLVGHREFYSLDLIVTPDVLVPRPETELLVDKAVEHLRSLGRPSRCWDICTGSGAVALAVAKNAPDAVVLATDVSDAALAVAVRNAAKHQLDERVTIAKADLLTAPDDAVAAEPFDVVTANPPYITDAEMAELPATVKHEPTRALCGGADGLDFIGPILRQAPDVLVAGGLLAVEIGYNQAAAVWELVQQVGRYQDVEFARDGAGIERTLVAKRA